VIEPLERGTARAVGSVAYCSNGFQSVACFRLRKIEIRPWYGMQSCKKQPYKNLPFLGDILRAGCMVVLDQYLLKK
jgi:hypothetical protein